MRRLILLLFVALCSLALTPKASMAQTGWKWANQQVFWHWGTEVDVIKMARDRFDNVYFVAMVYGTDTISFGPVTVTNPTGYEIVIVKVDSAGNYQWALTCADSANTTTYVPTCLNIAADEAGNLIMFAASGAPACILGATRLENPRPSASFDMCFLAKISPSGGVVWATNIGAHCGNNGGLGVDGNSNIYLAENFYDTTIIGPTMLLASGYYNSFVAKFDSSGRPIWAKQTKSASNRLLAGLMGRYGCRRPAHQQILCSLGATDLGV